MLLNNGRKVLTTYCFVPECNHAQEMQLCTGNAIMHRKCNYALEMQLCTGNADISIFMSTWFIFCNGQVLLVRKGNKQTNKQT